MVDKEQFEQLNISDLSELSAITHAFVSDLSSFIEKQKFIEQKIERNDNEEQTRKAKVEQIEMEHRKKHNNNVTSMDLPMDWENLYATDESVANDYVESISDGFVKCLNTKGCVDINYIAAISGYDCKTVIEHLRGSIYQNPDKWGECLYKGWETAEEYLSGHIRKKLAAAKKANRLYNGYFQDNVDALKKIALPEIDAEDIYVTLGSPWVPEFIIDKFVEYIREKNDKASGTYSYYRNYRGDVYYSHDTETGTWECKGRGFNDWEFEQKYGTYARPALDIILRTLNMQSLEVRDTVSSTKTKSGQKTVINKAATLEALEKQKLLINEFQEWIWKDPDRKKGLERIYDEKFGGIKQRHYDGSFLELPGMNPDINLYDYQKNAVARIIFSPNTLLAHDVGAGKTYIMIAAGMELKRMGISQRNMYVVPNNILGQWRRIFYELYPGAKIICIEPKDFVPKERQKVLRRIQKGNFDAVIIPYSCFTEIKISKKCKIRTLREEEERLNSIPHLGSKLKRKKEKLKNEIWELQKYINGKSIFSFYGDRFRETDEDKEEDEGICFDHLGITRLFVDEAHNFKNVPIETKIDKVMGISRVGSGKCKDMMDKVKIVQHDNNGAGVVFATGTPITNSVTDAFIMQSYLQSGELAILELQNFDSWIGMFAEKNSEFEVDVDTSNFRMATRFSKFHNIPELTNILANIADFHQIDEECGIPEHDGYEDVIVHKTPDFSEYLNDISVRADIIRSGEVNRAEDNMLLITTDGRKAALDMRLVNPKCKFTTDSKVYKCAEKVEAIYKETLVSRSTQLVFCDTSTPKEGFNIYDELKGLLVKMGVAEGEIAYIHDAATEKTREKLFESMRKGIIRILIGSTSKLGIGVNVQTKLIALHHLDVPWRPADMVQREGRILRPGNENKKVRIFRYITEGSFDAYSWQLLETKQRFITDILSGSIENRSGADVDDTVLNYAEVKALAIGNPLIKKRVEVANELTKYMILQRKLIDKHLAYKAKLPGLIERRKKIKEEIPKVKADAAFYIENKAEYTKEQKKCIRETIYRLLKTDEPIKEEMVAAYYNGFTVIIPKNASILHPVVYLENTGRYMVNLSSNPVMFMSKIDSVLDSLEDREQDLLDELTEITGKIGFIDSQLKSTEDYASEITELKEKLIKIDAKLGVN